jgi:hypothetical protein
LFDSFRKKQRAVTEPQPTKNSVLISLSESDRTDFGRVDFPAQSQDQKVFSAIWALESAVNCDGFASYLDSEDDSIPFAVEALETIGASQAAAIVRHALELPRESSNELTDEQLEELEGLDTAFTSYPDDLTSLLYAFVAARPESFGEVPDLSSLKPA